ncbi:MAG: 2-C-methyl-D-erythritol 4-phosphate cytidylyltransferase [Lachnospiraceae bacterium]|nr:2-C-methyl-D-erythritol 4-phosphate cytidylyltransferase [Lachnospiraceae bacterium]
MEDFSAVILAAGSGSRMGTKIKKQYLDIGGKPLIYYALKAFEKSDVSNIVLVVSPGDEEFVYEDIVKKYNISKVGNVVPGGSTRYFSVYEGLKNVKNRYVLVHDGARCLISDDIIERMIMETKEHEACVTAVPSIDTVRLSDEDGFVSSTPVRSRVWSIQTPQGFASALLKDAYSRLFEMGEGAFSEITDDAMIVERAFPDKKIKFVMGNYDNIKVTTPKDIAICEEIWQRRISI